MGDSRPGTKDFMQKLDQPFGSRIDFSAQFGGRDAADAVLPHFRALKAAAAEITLAGFPFPELSYILRVDGEVRNFGISGLGDHEVNRKHGYLSVDIGITLSDRGRICDVLTSALNESVSIVEAIAIDHALEGFDARKWPEPIKRLCQDYLNALAD